MMKKHAALIALFALSSGAAAFVASDISDPVVSVICGLFVAFKIIAGALASLVLVWAAIKYTASADDPGERKNVKDAVRYVVIGLIIIMLSEVIVLYVARNDLTAQKCSAWCSILPC